MARQNPQNASLSFPRRARDSSSATLALSYTGGVAAQSAVDYAVDLLELTTSSLDMQSGKTPRSVPSGYPSRTRVPAHLAAAFPGDLSFSSSVNYVLTADSHTDPQNSSTEHRQSIDISGEPSRSILHFRQDHPWNPLEAAEDFSQVASTTAGVSGSTQLPRTPFRNTDPYTNFQDSGFHDSALGTLTHDERQSLVSSPLAEMDDQYPFGYEIPSQPQDVLREEDGEESEPDPEPEDYDQQPTRPKTQRQPHTKESLTCDTCGHVSKTPSDHKKHKARHEAPYTCQVTDCPRSSKGFATVNDLNRHEKSVHGNNARNSKSYKCFAPNCAKGEKVWPRLDNFKQHLVRMHTELSVDDLVQSSVEWYEQLYGSSGPAQSAAVAGVLHSQEEAARGPSQKRKRRRDSSPTTDMPAQKRPTVNPLHTHELQHPPQDHTRLSPMSAQSRTRSPQLVRQTPNQQGFFNNMQNVRFAQEQDQRVSQQGRIQRLGRVGPAFVPARRAAAQGQNTLPSQEQAVLQLQFDPNVAFTVGTTVNATQSAVDQQSQSEESPAYNASRQRARTAPEIDDDFSHVRVALFDETHPIPPGQDDLSSFDQFIAGWGTGTTVPRCTPETSNEPMTPVQPGQVPTLVVGNESEDEKGDVNKAAKDLIAEELQSWIHELDIESKERQRLVANGNLGPFYLSLAKKSSHGSTSDVGMSHRSRTGSISSKAGKTNHICPTCQKLCRRQSELKKHEKRHSRPYGCVLDDCYKRFGSKNDLKRHEGTHPEQKECYRCDGNHRGQDGNPCRKVWYHGRDSFKQHIRTCVTTDPNQIERKANDCRIPANNVGRFWCGFCEKIVDQNFSGNEASANHRLSHIDSHFSQGKQASDWIELGGNGDTKAQVERNQNIAKNEQIEARKRGGQTVEEHGSSSTSSGSQTDIGQHHPTVQSRPQQQPIHQGQTLERQLSNATQYRQRMSQQLYNQQQQQQAYMAQQMQRARSSSQVMQQAMKVGDPTPAQRYNERGQALATQAECCQCTMQYLLDLSRKCASCDHQLCPTCKKR